MKLSEILQSGMVNDNTTIYVSKPLCIKGHFFKQTGKWYQDQVLDFQNDEITKLTYIQKENKIYVEVLG